MNLQNSKNNKDFFTTLILGIEKQLYNIAKSKLNNENDIEDVIQETILKIYKNYSSLKSPKHFKSWATKILINECNKYYQDKYKKDLLINKIITTKDLNTPEPLFIKVEANLNFNALLQDMCTTDKDIFLLYYNYKYSIKEIASILDLNENTIKSRIKRNKERLEKNMKGGSNKNEKQ